jgi:nucleolar protein 12
MAWMRSSNRRQVTVHLDHDISNPVSYSSVLPQVVPVTASSPAPIAKRKRDATIGDADTPVAPLSSKKKKKSAEVVTEALETMKIDAGEGEVASSKKKKTKSTSKASIDPSSHGDDLNIPKASSSKSKDVKTGDMPSDELEDEDDSAALVHESITGKTNSSKKAKYVPEGETSETRDQRTIFIGNLPLEVAKNRVSIFCFTPNNTSLNILYSQCKNS